MKDHSYWMAKAIEQARKSGTAFGAVIVNKYDHYIEARNTVKPDGPTAHAEMNALQKLKELDYNDVKELRLYSTVEPCPMCMSGIVWAGIGRVIYGASIADASRYGHQIHITSGEIADHAWYKIDLTSSIEREACIALFKDRI